MRIIGGKLRGKKLAMIRGTLIRPTADRLRESIFNILGDSVIEATVLDMFAGSGAHGIEALSRGAVSAVFMDKSKKAISIIQKNIRLCALEDRVKIIRWDIIKNLTCLKSYRLTFNLIFMDPPYNQNYIKPALLNLFRNGSIEKGACIVVEHSHHEQIPKNLIPFKILDQRRYGKTLVSFINYVV